MESIKSSGPSLPSLRSITMKKFVFAGLFAFASICAQAQTTKDALRLLEIEKYADAEAAFAKLTAAAPTPENYYFAGNAAAKMGKKDIAKQMFDKSMEVAGKNKNPLGHVGQGTLAILNGDKTTAFTHFDMARKESKEKSAEVMFRIGEAYTIFPTTDAPEGIKALTKASELNKTSAEIYVLLGDAFLLMNDGSSAGTQYDRAKAANSKYARAYIRYGDIILRTKNYNGALDNYKQGIAADSTYTPGYREIAELYQLAGRYPEALANYQKYIDRTDRNEKNLQQYAGYLFLNKRFDEAGRVIDEIKSKSDSPIYYRLVAYNQYETGKPMEAEASINQFFTLAMADTIKTPIKASDYEYRGKIAIKNGKDTTKAIEDLKLAIARDTLKVAAFKELGDSAFTKKQYATSARFYKAYAQTNRNITANEYFKYGQSLYFAKMYKAADSAFAMVTTLAPNSPTGLLYRGYANQGLDPKYTSMAAKPYFEEYLKFTADTSKVTPEQALTFKKPRAVALAYFAAMYANKADCKQALKYANDALAEDPANKQANQVVAAYKTAPCK